MKVHKVEISPEWFETCGDHSLVGLIGVNLAPGDTLELHLIMTNH